MTLDDAIALLTIDPFESWEWTVAERRRLGVPAPGGAAVDVWADVQGRVKSISAVVLLPPDALVLAARNGQLLAFLLARLIPTWHKSEQWLVQALKTAQVAPITGSAQLVVRAGWRITFKAIGKQSQATLTLERA